MVVSNTKPRLRTEEEETLELRFNFFSQVVTFSSVHHLTLHFPGNFGADNTKIYYIGLAGEFTQVRTLIMVGICFLQLDNNSPRIL